MGRRGPKERHGIPVRIRPSLYARLQTEAEARDFGVAWLVNRLITEGLDRLKPVNEMYLTRDD